MSESRREKQRVVFLFDVDNTLVDNDAIILDLREHLDREVGPERAKQYWNILEQLRSELGYVDYLGALQRCRDESPHEVGIFAVSHFLIDYPFVKRLYPRALQSIEHVGQWGDPVILSDGDVVFQPHKVDRAGLAAAVDGRVLIYVHKQRELVDVAKRFPADRYVMIDDKMAILADIKDSWKSRVTTVFVKQGHYANQPDIVEKYGRADVTLGSIAELLTLDPRSLDV